MFPVSGARCHANRGAGVSLVLGVAGRSVCWRLLLDFCRTENMRSINYLLRMLDGVPGRWDLEDMKMRKDDDSSSGQAVMDHALAWSRNVFDAQVSCVTPSSWLTNAYEVVSACDTRVPVNRGAGAGPTSRLSAFTLRLRLPCFDQTLGLCHSAHNRTAGLLRSHVRRTFVECKASQTVWQRPLRAPLTHSRLCGGRFVSFLRKGFALVRALAGGPPCRNKIDKRWPHAAQIHPHFFFVCVCVTVVFDRWLLSTLSTPAQFDDLDSALVASVDHMEQSNLSSLEAASRDSELVVLQARIQPLCA